MVRRSRAQCFRPSCAIEDQSVRQSERAKNVDPAFTTVEIIYFATPILTKPKPEPEVESDMETPKQGTETPKTDEQAKADNGPSEMDVD